MAHRRRACAGMQQHAAGSRLVQASAHRMACCPALRVNNSRKNHPAIDVQRFASDILAIGRREVHDGRGDVLRASQSA
jgi:hypothetical protein